MTILDALLLQRSKAFFTGGFLAPVHTSGVAEAAAFLALSVLADAALVGLLAWAALLLLRRWRLTSPARALGVLLVSVGPLLFMNFVSYRLASYLGDAFDLGLMFELAGRRVDEIVAVASPQIVRAVTLTLAAGVGAVGAVWVVNRPRAWRTVTSGSPRRLMAPVAVLLIVGSAAATVAGLTHETFEDGLRRKPSGRVIETVLARLTDVDRDGFGLVGGMRDPAWLDASVYPWAVDVPGNGIDENGVGGDLPADTAPYVEGPVSVSTWHRRPDVVLIVLESFRADAVGRVVNGKPVTPVLDALAREGISSSRAYSHNGYTAQSRFHLMTGSLAGLREGSLIDDFAANGYQTAYFSAQDESFGGEELSVGFERADVRYDARQDRARRYSNFSTPGSLAVSADVLEERIAEFLSSRDRSKPLFLYVNFHDTHYPYHHREVEALVSSVVLPASQFSVQTREALQEMYFNTAAYVDRAIGRVLGSVAASVGTPPAVIVTADHGESLFDESFLGHGYALNDVQTRIPLIVRGLPMVIEEPFGQADLRDAIGAAMGSTQPASTPQIGHASGTPVLQYLGGFSRPRQIAHLDGGGGRTIYDFRTRRSESTGGTSPSADSGRRQQGTGLLALIHQWERMSGTRAGS